MIDVIFSPFTQKLLQYMDVYVYSVRYISVYKISINAQYE